jgi:hypothetical protein
MFSCVELSEARHNQLSSHMCKEKGIAGKRDQKTLFSSD